MCVLDAVYIQNTSNIENGSTYTKFGFCFHFVCLQRPGRRLNKEKTFWKKAKKQKASNFFLLRLSLFLLFWWFRFMIVLHGSHLHCRLYACLPFYDFSFYVYGKHTECGVCAYNCLSCSAPNDAKPIRHHAGAIYFEYHWLFYPKVAAPFYTHAVFLTNINSVIATSQLFSLPWDNDHLHSLSFLFKNNIRSLAGKNG